MNKPMLVSKDFFEHLLNCLDNQKYNPTADAQEAIDKATSFGRQRLKGAKPFNWQEDAKEHEEFTGTPTPPKNLALSPPEVEVITFDTMAGPGVQQSWIYGISWVLERGSGKGSIITAVDDKTEFKLLLNQQFDAIVLQSQKVALMIKGVQITKYQSGISIDDISVDEAWEYTFKEITGWRKEPYAVKEGNTWKLC